ncbi:MAG: hypothetical protein E7165_02235 [Firmicutes bacterium]|nr:hypothetical protein [Bacillota bacterium]
MNYIYDILINLQKKLYDFYEWNLSDDIIHVRKIPLIKVNNVDMLNIRNKQIIMNDDFLKVINNRTEVFSNHNIRIIKYLCLFSNDEDVVAVEFSKNGTKVRVSKLLIDEELEVLEVSEHISVTEVVYQIEDSQSIDNFKTRKELKIYDYILKQLNKSNYERIKYLYFECFDRQEEDLQIIINDIEEELKNNWKLVYEKIYNILKLSSQRQ